MSRTALIRAVERGSQCFLKCISYIIPLALSTSTSLKPVTGLVLKQAKAEATAVWLQLVLKNSTTLMESSGKPVIFVSASEVEDSVMISNFSF